MARSIEIKGKRYEIIEEYSRYWSGWECDTSGYIVKDEHGNFNLVLSDHGSYYFADTKELIEDIEILQKAVLRHQSILSKYFKDKKVNPIELEIDLYPSQNINQVSQIEIRIPEWKDKEYYCRRFYEATQFFFSLQKLLEVGPNLGIPGLYDAIQILQSQTYNWKPISELPEPSSKNEGMEIILIRGSIVSSAHVCYDEENKQYIWDIKNEGHDYHYWTSLPKFKEK